MLVKFESMKTIHLQVPDDVDLKDFEYIMIIAAKLYEDGKLSSGQAAQEGDRRDRSLSSQLGTIVFAFAY